MTRTEHNVLINTCFGHFLSHFNMLVFPAVVLPLAAQLDLPLAEVLGISFWMYLLFGLTALPWGLVADRFGGKRLTQLYYAGAGICGLTAAYWINSPNLLTIALAGVGFFSGIYHPTGLGMISKQMTRVSVGMGINGMFGNIGLATAPLVAGLVNWIWGPCAVYIVLGILNLLGLIVTALLPLPEATAIEKQSKGKGGGARCYYPLDSHDAGGDRLSRGHCDFAGLF